MDKVDMEAVFVIVGGGIAGVSCSEALDFWSPESTVILITSSYLIKAVTNVVQLTKTLAQFDVEEKQASSLTENRPNLTVLKDIVVEIDPEKHKVRTESGKIISYKKLCLCSGGQPKIIKENSPYVIGIRDTDSIRQFQKKVSSARRMVVVGNGGIATEIIYEIKGIEKIWVVKDKHVSSTFVDAGAAQFFQDSLDKETSNTPSYSTRMKYTVDEDVNKAKENSLTSPALGPDWHRDFEIRGLFNDAKVNIEYECSIADVVETTAGNNWPIEVRLTNGKLYGCDFVVSATGVTPNGSLIKCSKGPFDLAADGGIKVDARLSTNLPDIFAAGDVCTAAWNEAPHWHQMRLWTQARQMGLYAAQSMSASITGETILQDFCFELFSHVTKFFGFKVVLLGLFNGQKLDNKYELLLRVTKGMEYIKLVVKDGKMQGALLIGDTDLEEMCENLILNQLDISQYGEDILNPDIDIEDYFD